MFGIGPSELVVLAVIGLVVLGPEKLPKLAADAVRFLRDLRVMVDRARRDVREQLGPDFADLSLRDLDPRTLVTRTLFDGDPDPLGLREEQPSAGPSAGPSVPAQQPRLAPGEAPPYDDDAT